MEDDKKGEESLKSVSSEDVLVAETEEKSVNGEGGNGDNVEGVLTQQERTPDESLKDISENIEDQTNDKIRSRKRKVNEVKTGDESASEDSVTDSRDTENLQKSLEKDDSANESDINMPPKQTLGKGKRARIPNKRYSDILLSPSSRSHHKVNTSLENGGEKYEKNEKVSENAATDFNTKDDEIANLPNVTSLKSRSNTSSPAAKRPKLSADLSDPKFRKPFVYGWKRELVYRATCDNPNKRNGDIYYYTPAGKKLRSMREVSENLKNRELSLENFTFFKEPLGLDDPEKEIIRDAKAWFNKKSTKTGGGNKTPRVLSPKASTSKTPAVNPKVTSPKAGLPEEKAAKTKGSNKNLGNIKVKLPPSKSKSEKKSASKVEEEPMDVEPPSSAPSQSKRGMSKKTPAKQIQNEEMESGKPCQPCSIRCEGVSGMVPTLQCLQCLCLYHYECVGLSPLVQIQEYICKNCQLDRGENNNEQATALPSLTLINSLNTIQSQSNIIPTLQRILPQEQEIPSVQSESKSLVGAVTSWLPHSSTIQVDSVQKNKDSNEPTEAPRPQYVEYLAGRKFLIIPKHNVVSVRPNMMINRMMEKDVVDENKDEDKTETVESPRAKRRAIKSNNVTTNDKHEEPKFMDSYLQNLSYGYNTLLYVFQYLKVQDLLRAGCVCTMWRDIASHSSLWRTVRMKNSQVHSFEGLANTLQKHGTVHLDLRKMLLPTNVGDDIWPEFSKAIQKVQTLRKIELCRCPASVVEQLAVTNKDIEVINAVTIKCENMSLDLLSSLRNLKELRLKSTSGLTLSSDITSLKELTNLKHLSLTSIKDLNKMNLNVISALKSLESLDLGECSDFPENFGKDILIELKNLEKLRLEKGQGNCHTFEILDAARQMPHLEQLELVNFDIKTGFDVALGGCKNIRKLLIIPTYISQSATTNHMVLGGVLRLQSTLSHFVWGVTLELLRVTELFVDQCEDPDKKEKRDKKPVGNGDSIPVLKPVPLITSKDDAIPPAHDPPQVEILPLPNLQKLLLQSLPTTRVKILKIPFHATWRQSITDTVN